MEIKIGKKELRVVFILVLLAIAFYWALHETDQLKNAWSYISAVFSPFAVGAALAFVLNVPTRGFERLLHNIKSNSVRRVTAILLSFLSIILVFAIVILLVVPQVKGALESFVAQLPSFFDNLNATLNQFFEKYPNLKPLFGMDSEQAEIDWMPIVRRVIDALETSISTLLGSAVSFVSNFASALFNAVVSIVFGFYCLTQKEQLVVHARRLLYSMCKAKTADEIIRIARMTNSAFSNFITGQTLEAIVLALLFVPVLAIFRMPYIPLICVLIAVTALVPLVGAFIAMTVGAFLILVDNPMKAVTFIILFQVVQQFENNVTYPRVVGKSVGLHSMWVLVAVVAGGSLFGVVGMLAMVPVASVIFVLLQEFTTRRLEKRQVPEEKLVPQPPELQHHVHFDKVRPASIWSKIKAFFVNLFTKMNEIFRKIKDFFQKKHNKE